MRRSKTFKKVFDMWHKTHSKLHRNILKQCLYLYKNTLLLLSATVILMKQVHFYTPYIKIYTENNQFNATSCKKMKNFECKFIKSSFVSFTNAVCTKATSYYFSCR